MINKTNDVSVEFTELSSIDYVLRQIEHVIEQGHSVMIYPSFPESWTKDRRIAKAGMHLWEPLLPEDKGRLKAIIESHQAFEGGMS